MAWSFAGSALSAGIGALSSNASAYKQYKYQSALQSQAAKLNYDYSLKSAKNMPSATRQGLESGGYNPMLAVQNATSGANSSWTSAGQSTAPDYNAGITQGVANAQSFQRLKNETEQAESVTDANYATADKVKAEKAEITARLPFVSKRQKAEIAQIEADAQLLEAKKHYLSEDIAVRQAGVNVQQEANAVSERNNIRTLRTQRTRINGPFGIGWHAGSYKDSAQYWYDR